MNELSFFDGEFVSPNDTKVQLEDRGYQFGDGIYGSNLVLRGRDATELTAAVEELIAALTAAGIENVREVEGV